MILRTTLHHYRFESAADPAYKAMCQQIKANAEGRGHRMNVWSSGKNASYFREHGTSEVVEIETAHLFDNQWNTADRRVFDWYEEYRNDHVKRGHWLEITPEMAAARRDTLKCGYCGKQFGPHHAPIPATPFCTGCLDSEYLKPEELHLLRLLPVIGPVPERAKLTEEERAVLLPEYVRRQTTGSDSRANQKRLKQREEVLAKFKSETENATRERDGMLWLWDHGVSLDNVIYYDHTSKFSFGWRSPVSQEVKAALLDLLCEFPFEYEIKTTR